LGLRDRSTHREEDSAAFRRGSASLGLIVGMLAGLAVAVFIAAKLRLEVPVPLLVFGFAVIGAVGGYFYSSAALATVEGVVHLLLGFVVGVAERIINPLPESPWWLKSLYWVGLVCGLFFVLRYRR
jgi:vacuolar-type H+-ATPase subunit I/STV1